MVKKLSSEFPKDIHVIANDMLYSIFRGHKLQYQTLEVFNIGLEQFQTGQFWQILWIS